MPRDISNRLTKLRTRRTGTDRLLELSSDARIEILAKSLTEENWQNRARLQPYTRYALGAMQEVSPDYTRISIETAERVANQLVDNFSRLNSAVTCELQGSVPLNVHIRGVSDVDLLLLDAEFLIYDTSGALSSIGHYTPRTETSLDMLIKLRYEAEKILKVKFPVAKVDTSGGKAINISAGSLARPVDVVPALWYDTADYQASRRQSDRGVVILNKKVPETIKNHPFKHIERITERCNNTYGGLRKAIRLCKNIKADAESEGTEITLPSFDIAAAMYHANQQALQMGMVFELAILSEAQRHLDALACNLQLAATLRVPDGSRLIFDTEAKLHGLRNLSIELDDLVQEVAKEHSDKLRAVAQPILSDGRQILESIRIPDA